VLQFNLVYSCQLVCLALFTLYFFAAADLSISANVQVDCIILPLAAMLKLPATDAAIDFLKPDILYYSLELVCICHPFVSTVTDGSFGSNGGVVNIVAPVLVCL